MARNWTENQIDAINARGGSVIVSAAAGSGKTAVLVERVIRLITDAENGVDADRLLVVTYTRKAAAELKGRLKDALTECIRNQPDNAFLIRQQSKLSKAHISTVDSFCMSLVKEYSFLLDIDRNCRIGEEGELKVLQADAMQLTLDTLYTEADSKFLRLTDTFASARDDSRLEDNIIRLYTFLRSHPFPRRWMAEKLSYYTDFTTVFDSVWGQIISRYTSEAAEYMKKLLDRAFEALSEDDKLYQKNASLFETYCVFLERLDSAMKGHSWDDICSVLRSFAYGSFKTPSGYKEHPSKIAAASAREVFRDTVVTLQKLYAVDEAMCLYDIELLKDHAEQIFRAVTLFDQNYSMLKKEHGVADYADIEHWVLDLIIDEQTMARTSVADEIAARFDCVMVDEYQDANEAQDTIFKTISKNETNLFVVGDVKQSIYGFRQAMPQLFLNRKNNARLYNRDHPAFPAKIILEKNFRSDGSVLAAVNFVFSKLMSLSVGDIEYNEEEQLYPGAVYEPQREPAVELDIIDREACGEEEAAIAEARYIAERIHEMVADSYPVKDGDTYRPATFSDFAVLMRNISSYGAVYREVFERYGIHAIAESRSGFLGTREVMVMTNLLRVIDNPALDIELLSVVMSPVFGFDEDDLARIRIGERRGSLYAAIVLDADSGNAKSKKFIEELAYYRSLSVTVPLYKLITVIYDRASFVSVMAASDSSGAAIGNLRLLLDYARGYEQHTGRGLSGFVGYLDRLIEDGSDLPSASSDSGGDFGVELMTVHASKGLEFPVCFIANTARKLVSDTTKAVLLHAKYGYAQKRFDPVLSAGYHTMPRSAVALEMSRDEMSEELRVLYVAMTRAKQKLIMLSTPGSNVNKYISNTAKKLSGQRKISPFAVRSANTLSDWLVMCALLHPDGEPLRAYADVDIDCEPQSDFSLLCRVIDTPFDAAQTDGAMADSTAVKTDESVAALLSERAGYRYPYDGLRSLPTKVAASALAHRFAEKSYDRHLDRPAFLSDEKLTSAEKGTALHAFMQFADFAAARTDIKAEITRLRDTGYLTEAQADSIDIDKASRFFGSHLISRCLKADRVYKEYRFTVHIPAYKVKPDIEEQLRDEKIVLQGSADLAFTEDGELVIVDYKTDRVKDPGMLAERYAVQLMLYKDALSECLGLPVKECLIYSVHHSAEISVFRSVDKGRNV